MKYHKRDENWKAFLAIGVIIVLISAVYFTFYFYYQCNNSECFKAHQQDCARTIYVKDTEDTTWQYLIEGEEDEKCKINVKVLSIKTGSIDKKKLEDASMDCYLPLGSLVAPESDISRCEGPLKEKMQEIIIQKLHAYIIENVENIGSGLEDIGNGV